MVNKTITLIDSPVGELFLEQREGMLTRLHFVSDGEKQGLEKSGRSDPSAFREVISQLEAYFRGELREFDVPLLLEGTEFQKRAWKVLQKIPYGETISYGEQAIRMGSPKAVRAVGGANHRNPVAIIVPCHRVIGKSGDLTGFGGGLDIKARLLELEKV
ncbi:MAG: methylated-DNA--[protein]-cysteine S-methyltransferase [Bacteroidales bacterium]|nr:methylated-DNA--[protein]-cysteine S-methyltransferase [Candidatus Latescibacterota bacterium]